MSFILDALKKSETERQEQGSAEFVNVPTSGDRREGPPAWLWILGALLLVNLVVLAGIVMRPDVRPPAARAEAADTRGTARVASVTAAAAIDADDAAPADENFADRLAEARATELPRDEPATAPGRSEDRVAPARTRARATSTANTAALPTVHEVMANGLVNVGELHVDIHVFAGSATDRFVFINMAKYKEGDRLAEGPLVEEITADGVVLSHDGTTFLVPRD